MPCKIRNSPLITAFYKRPPFAIVAQRTHFSVVGWITHQVAKEKQGPEYGLLMSSLADYAKIWLHFSSSLPISKIQMRVRSLFEHIHLFQFPTGQI